MLKNVYCNGLNKIISAIDGEMYVTFKQNDPSRGENLIFVVADANDATKFGKKYAEGTSWLIVRGRIFSPPTMAQTYLNSLGGMNGSVSANDSVETILNKFKTQLRNIFATDEMNSFNPLYAKVGDASLTTPHYGHMYYDSSVGILYVYDGEKYTDVSHYTEIVDAMREIIEEFVGEDVQDTTNVDDLWYTI